MTSTTYTLLIGNPGVGKSTILNSLIGDVKFISGVSYGHGLTQVLQMEQDRFGNVYMDTPGLSDAKMRERAAKEITQALKQNGIYKIIFVLTLESGRVRPADLATMKLVLDSAPVIARNYAIIVNKLSRQIIDDLDTKPEEKQKIEIMLNAENPSPTSHIFFYGLDPECFDINNVKLTLSVPFVNFINSCPIVRIEPPQVKQIAASDFEQHNEMFGAMLEELKSSNNLLRGELERQQQRAEAKDQEFRDQLKQMQRENREAYDKQQQEYQAAQAAMERRYEKMLEESRRNQNPPRSSGSGGFLQNLGAVLDKVINPLKWF